MDDDTKPNGHDGSVSGAFQRIFDHVREVVTVGEQITLVLDRLNPGTRKLSLQRIGDLFCDAADALHDARRLAEEMIRQEEGRE